MSNDLVRAGQKALVSSDNDLSSTLGKSMVVGGSTVLGLGVLAWFLPFVTLPMLAVLMIVAGLTFYLW